MTKFSGDQTILISRGIQLVLPMAGEGRRFRAIGVVTPKPLLDVHGVSMFELVLMNLMSEYVVSVTLVMRREFELQERVSLLSERLSVPITTVMVDGTTCGPACSVQLTSEVLVPDLPVVVANTDQFISGDLSQLYMNLMQGNSAGVILTMEDDDPKWSYVRLDPDGNCVEVVEKQVISKEATVGVYGFAGAGKMLRAIERMKESGASVRGEYYVGPAYNFLEKDFGPIKTINLGPIRTVMYGLGIPEDLSLFLQNKANLREVERLAKKWGFPRNLG